MWMMTSSDELSEDTTIEILSRLAVKSLMRFRCVCKYWDVLVTNHDFVSKHLKNYNNDNTHLVVRYETIVNSVRRNILCFFLDETLKDLSYEELNPQSPLLGCSIGLYNGILCLIGQNNRIVLWNMATQESRILPKCKLAFPAYKNIEYTKFGFGLDPISNDYKLISITGLWDEVADFLYEFSHIAIYNLITDSWTTINGNGLIPYHMDRLNDSTYMNGACYWLLQNNQQIMLSFNMADEVFLELQRPFMTDPTTSILGINDDCLSLLVLHDADKLFDVWVMKDNSWTKLFTVGPVPAVIWPLGFWKNGAFFVETINGELLLYDPSSHVLRDLQLRTVAFNVYGYKESLISVKRNDYFDASDIPWHVLGVNQ